MGNVEVQIQELSTWHVMTDCNEPAYVKILRMLLDGVYSAWCKPFTNAEFLKAL